MLETFAHYIDLGNNIWITVISKHWFLQAIFLYISIYI